MKTIYSQRQDSSVSSVTSDQRSSGKSNLTGGRRDANMDLMRITAMCLVMVYHVNYWGIAQKYAPITTYNELQIFGYTLMKCVAMVCVNMFVLISGWYGIRPNIKKLLSLFFQVWFFSILGYLVFVFSYEDIHFSIAKFVHYIFFSDYWFVPAYLLLYILSPILNSFVENSTKRNLMVVIICFYLFQFVYGWFDRSPYFDHGCSPLVFLGLYLIARFLRIHNELYDKISISKVAVGYLLVLFITVLLCTLMAIKGNVKWAELLMQYSSPFTVCLSVLLLIFFSKLKLNSYKTIALLGTSSFAVYLFHDSTYFYEKIFYPIGCWIYVNNSTICSLLLLFLFLSVIYLISFLLDLMRIVLWEKIARYFNVSSTNSR
ncbi:MAG: acyltransferase [Prevotella sp.]|nr:acyltransferase [Prevotella sp.]